MTKERKKENEEFYIINKSVQKIKTPQNFDLFLNIFWPLSFSNNF
jgi:hypothetical protein